MQVEVDQSGRIDQTNKPTVLAMANGCSYSILVSPAAKKKCLHVLRQKWGSRNPKSLYIFLFATLLFILIKDQVSQARRFVVDVELPGHEGRIKEHVLNLFRRHNLPVDDDIISFQRIGKKSPAHDLAIKVFRGKLSPDREVSAEEVLAEFGK